MTDIIVGIDIGTTNLEVTIVEGGKPRRLSENREPTAEKPILVRFF